MCDEPNDDELMNAVLFKLQIQIGVGKATGTPMLRGDNLPGLGSNPGRISPPHVPNSKLFRNHPAKLIDASMLFVYRRRLVMPPGQKMED